MRNFHTNREIENGPVLTEEEVKNIIWWRNNIRRLFVVIFSVNYYFWLLSKHWSFKET